MWSNREGETEATEMQEKPVRGEAVVLVGVPEVVGSRTTPSGEGGEGGGDGGGVVFFTWRASGSGAVPWASVADGCLSPACEGWRVRQETASYSVVPGFSPVSALESVRTFHEGKFL